MAYRNATYVAFDSQGTNEPRQSDIKYFNLLKAWANNYKFDLLFYDAHQRTNSVLDTSKRETLKARLRERLNLSKNLFLIITDQTDIDNDTLNFEIEYAINKCNLPIIIAYTKYEYILNPKSHLNELPSALQKNINEAKCIHIPFKKIQ